MPRRHLAALLPVLALLVSAAPVSAQELHEEEELPSVFVVGDSHVRMIGPLLTRALAGRGYRAAGYESRHGWSTARYVREGDLRAVLEAHGRPEVVVVSLGGNDFVGSAEAYRAQLAWIVGEARAAGAREVVWIGPATSDATVSERAASTGARHERNAELQRALVPELGARWIDSRPATVAHHAPDGVHFTRDGYRTWVAATAPAVEATAARLAQVVSAPVG